MVFVVGLMFFAAAMLHLVQDSALFEAVGQTQQVEVCVEDAERRRAITSVCSYIVFQCSRPPQLHSRDLHSIIVAAFHCLNVWLTQHPTMLNHQECLLEVLEIVELGISGSKSRQEEEVRCKEEKDLNPASLRVKEAAEATLSCVMQVSGAFPFPGGLLDEDSLTGCSSSDVKKFRYFVVDSSVILAMLEPEHASCPSLTVLIRAPSGSHAWALQLHLQPREGRTQTQHTLIPDHTGGAQEDAGIQCGVKHQLFPENIDRVPSVKADLSIPDLNKSLTEEVQQQLERLRAVMERQRQAEARPQVNTWSVVMTTCRPPSPVTNFQTARLFLSHLGLLTLETLKDPGTSGVPAQLVSLDSSLPGFWEDLKCLDQLPSRNSDSAFVFYMRAGQRTAAEILRNVESNFSVSSHFLGFLASLGWPVAVGRQQVGGVSTNSSDFPVVLGDSGGGVFNGERFVLMYADALTEMTFIVPSLSSYKIWLDPSILDSAIVPEGPDYTFREEQGRRRLLHGPIGQLKMPSPSPSTLYTALPHLDQRDTYVRCCSAFNTIVPPKLVTMLRDLGLNIALFDWLLNFLMGRPQAVQDWQHHILHPDSEHRASNVQLIFIHPLKTGLYQIRFHGNAISKFGLVVPLVNGSVISKRALALFTTKVQYNPGITTAPIHLSTSSFISPSPVNNTLVTTPQPLLLLTISQLQTTTSSAC
ncbi:hypothetical protein L3Q82_024498 [Scortum barcoo]|uniref:Uncharacterized protein n=1 Tax=Scortum barcoo TaxID=214431 RepID=A0ACB8WP07_9TELE|nr:hypothetical protein L3Q82_024498 [Scortum barcoo]